MEKTKPDKVSHMRNMHLSGQSLNKGYNIFRKNSNCCNTIVSLLYEFFIRVK